jgi:hypothetical protein
MASQAMGAARAFEGRGVHQNRRLELTKREEPFQDDGDRIASWIRVSQLKRSVVSSVNYEHE